MGHGHSHHHGHSHGHAHGARDAEAEKLMRRATYFATSMALGLLAAKGIAWWLSGSLALLSSLTDSLFDVISSTINLLALRYALKPADDDHRFGHTSIEDIASLGQFAFIVASMAIISLQSAERLFHPQPLAHETIGIYVSLGAIVLTTALVAYQTMVTRRSASLIIASERMHYLSDLLFNVGVLIALGASMVFHIVWADPAMAIVIAVVVLWTNRVIGIRAFNNLMDRELPDEEKEKIVAIATATEGILRFHKMKTRYSGAKAFIQMYVDIDEALDFPTAHDISDRLQDNLLAAFPGAEVIIHAEPAPAETSHSRTA